MPLRLRQIQQRKAARSCKEQDPALLSESVSLLADLHNDLTVLKNFDGTPRKVAYKKERIGHYMPWVKGLIEGDQGHEDKILQHMLVWSIDICDIDQFLMIAEYMAKHELNPPFETKLASFVSDNAREQIATMTIDEALAIESFLSDKDVNEKTHAQFLRLLGEKLLETDEPTIEVAEEVEEFWARALELDQDVGVKTKLKALTKSIEERKASETAE